MKFAMGSLAPFAFIAIISFLAADLSLELLGSGSAEPSIQLAHVSADQFLKSYNCAICCNALTSNNPQD